MALARIRPLSLQGRHEFHNTRKQNVHSRATGVLMPLVRGGMQPTGRWLLTVISELHSFTSDGDCLFTPYFPQ